MSEKKTLTTAVANREMSCNWPESEEVALTDRGVNLSSEVDFPVLP